VATTRRTPHAVTGFAQVDRRTKQLVKRLQPGDIAIVNHDDLDRVAAENLVRAKVSAVVNAGRFITGRYPNTGPLLLAAAGVALIDNAGPEVMEAVADGDLVRIDRGRVMRGEEVVAKGSEQTIQSLQSQLEAAKQVMGEELERFAQNTLEYLQRERHLLTDAPNLPDLRVDLKGRHVLLVVRGFDYREDLSTLRAYIKEVRPVLIGVDGGADALLEFRLKPDVIIGDFDSVSDKALMCGAQLVVHAYPGGGAPGAARLEGLGRAYSVFEGAGTSEDIAMLLAYEKGCELIVAVGTHASMVEFLDKGRQGMASTFLTRLKVGPILVDAKGVSRLYQSRVRKRDLAFLVAAAILAMVVMVLVSEPLRFVIRVFWTTQ
jgi:uncharacterized membrane-anchored protein